MAIVLSGTTNDITVNGVSVATDAEVNSALALKANTSDVNTLLSLKANTADLKEIGVGQTWQDVTASRTQGVTYTNTTGKPIFVEVYSIMTVANVGWCIQVDGFFRGGQRTDVWAGNSKNTVMAIVPNNSTYSVVVSAGSITINTWSELR